MIAQPADPDAIRAQLETLHAESFTWALVCCAHDPAEAEDVLQMTYLKILDNRARYAGRSAFKTWLFGVIRFTAREQRRWAWLRRFRGASVEEAARQPATDASPDDATARGETIAQVQAACGRLPTRQREVLMLVFQHELALDEAAVVMGVSPGSARKHYQRAKEQLRAWLGPHFSKRRIS
jgi:RNA polymerase sigma-70 factor (ECF subfamily)